MKQPNQTMINAALAGMTHVLDLVPADSVLVVTDEATSLCGQAFEQAAIQCGCDVVLYQLPQEHRPLQKMPDEMHPLLDGKTIVINAIVGDAREIPFRLEWLFKVDAVADIRMGHSPGINAEMMSAGPLNVDYAAMQNRADLLFKGFEKVVTAHIYTELGTDLVLDLKDRPIVSDLKATPSKGANLPCGEVFCCPVENGANGTLVIDGCFGSCGIVPSPVTLVLENGVVTDISCEDQTILEQVTTLMDTDAGSRTIAELGIGLNPGARLSDNMLEAEKVQGTAHIAFGSNQGMPGGQNISQTHIDYLFNEPTIVVTRNNGTKQTLMSSGELE
jgi:aminopeptidase